MSIIYELEDNYKVLLDKLTDFKLDDLYVYDIDFFNFCVEFYYTEAMPTINEEDYPELINYGAKFFEDIKLGEGSYGRVFKFGNGKVLKIGLGQMYLTIKDLENKETYNNIAVNNNILEGLSGIYFNDVIKSYTPAVTKINGVYVTNNREVVKYPHKYPWHDMFIGNFDNNGECNIVSTLMESLNSMPKKTYRDNIYYILYIVLHAIYVAQSKCEFVHGDLHLGNVMFKEYPEGEDINLVFKNKIVTIKSLGWIPVIIDFGFSSFTHEGKRVSSFSTAITQSGSAFDRYFDFIKIFVSTVTQLKVDFSKLEDCFMKNKHPKEYYEPDKTDRYYINKDIRSPRNILNRLLDLIPHSVERIDTDIIEREDLISKIIKVKEDTIINDFCIYKNIKYKTSSRPFFTEAAYSNVLNVHLIEINKIDDDYKFMSVCCKQNLVDFTNDNRDSISINGTYFDMETMGSLYNNKYRSDGFNFTMIKRYLPYYGTLDVNSSHIAIRDKVYIDEIGSEPNKHLLTGPVLVYDKELPKIYTDIDNIFSKYKGKEYMFTCTNKEEGMTSNMGIEYHKCSDIRPGELYHIGNPNPRTVIAIKGDTTYFIVIEGRTEEYKGASVEQMYDFLYRYLKVDRAINLDGGASSCMMWSKDGRMYSPLNIYSKKTIGNLISLVKK